jgi:phenylacetate-CoA ligase
MNWLFRRSLKLNGFPIDKAQLEYFRIIHGKIPAQERAYSQFLKFKSSHPFYQSFLKSKQARISKWLDIPVIKKSDFQVDIQEIIPNGQLGDLHVHNTSGSTGTPFYFAKNKFCHAMTWAHTDAKLLEHGLELGGSLQARFYGIPLGGMKYYKERLKDKLSARVRYPVFDLSDEKLSVVLEEFKRKPFIYVNGYTSSLVVFAKFLISQGIILKELCPTLQCVMPTSEVCDDIDRKNLEKGFGVKVINEYGAAELDVIGFEDPDGDFVLNEETLFVEVLDDNNHPVKPGIEGKVVITSLYNEVMPFIRYEIGDRAILQDKMKHGRRVLDRVLGRTNDIIKLPSGKISPGLTFYYISKKLLEEGGRIKEFVIRQTKLNEFVLEYVSTVEMSDEEKKNVIKAMELYLESGLTVRFLRTERIERTAAGKLKHFFSEL